VKRILLRKKDSTDLEDQTDSPSPKPNRKIKLKVSGAHQANSVEKLEDQENDRRQEILMDSQPRLRIFRFKQVKTCLDENQKD
jgi:hypothetical protein